MSDMATTETSTATTETSTEARCQHCGGAVRFGMTEHGYRGFVHVADGRAQCRWLVQIVEDGLGEVVWQGHAADAAAALRSAADQAGWNAPASRILDGFRDVNRDGSRWEDHDAFGDRTCVVEVVR